MSKKGEIFINIYASLGIREIWRFDGQDLFIYCLQEQGYEEKDHSQVLPILSKSLILTFLKKRGEIGENAVICEFRQIISQK